MRYGVIMNFAVALLGYYINNEAVSILDYKGKSDRMMRAMAMAACILLGLIMFEVNSVYIAFPIVSSVEICILALSRFTDYEKELMINIRRLCTLMLVMICGYAVLYLMMQPLYDEVIIFIIFLILEYVVVKAYSAISGSSNSVRKGIVIIMPMIFVAIVVFVVANMEMEVYQRMLFSVLVVLVVIFSLTAYNILITQYETEAEERLLEEQNEAYRKQVDYVTLNDESVRAIRHDMKNHIITIKRMVDRKEYSKLALYVSEMAEHAEVFDEYMDTGNLELDAIINSKKSEMDRYKINFDSDIVIPEKLTVSGYDMAVIVGNMLDNAICAVKELDESQRCINLYMRYARETLYIQQSNQYKGSITIGENNLPVTAKEDKNLHGIGIRNISKTVEKYDGKLKIAAQDNWFNMDIEIGVR